MMFWSRVIIKFSEPDSGKFSMRIFCTSTFTTRAIGAGMVIAMPGSSVPEYRPR